MGVSMSDNVFAMVCLVIGWFMVILALDDNMMDLDDVLILGTLMLLIVWIAVIT